MRIPLEKLKLLHSIRGFAAIYVVVFHAKFILWSGGSEYLLKYPLPYWKIPQYTLFALDMISSAGVEMVMVFFVLSGFFIGYSFENNQWRLTKFYQNRTLRIYPPYLGAILLSCLLIWLVCYLQGNFEYSNNHAVFKNKMVVLCNSLNMNAFFSAFLFYPIKGVYLADNGVYWSLFYEAIFYCLVPFAVRRTRSYFVISLITLALALIFIPLKSFYIPSDFSNPLLTFFSNYSIFFAAGLLLQRKNEVITKKLHRFNKWIAVLILASIFCLIIILELLHMRVASCLCAGVFGCGAICLFLAYNFRENIVLAFFKKLGVFSYSLYLIHVPILYAAYIVLCYYRGYSLFYDRVYWLAVLITIPLSWLFYLIFEKKSLVILQRIKRDAVA